MVLLYWLLCIVIGGVPAWLLFRSDRKKNIPVKWLPALLRFLTFFLTAALLLAPAFPTTKTNEEKPLLLWLQDNSTSMKASLGKDSNVYKNKVNALLDAWKDNYTVVPLSFGAGLTKDSLFLYHQHSTDIAKALQQAAEQYQDRNIGAVILSSDGIVNEGVNPLYAPLGNAFPIYSLAVGDSAQPVDLSVNRVYVNKTVALNSSFEIMVDLRAEKLNGKTTNLNLLHNGKNINQSAVKIDKDRFTASFRFETKADVKGFQRYTVELPKQDGEPNISNNRMDFFVEVIDEETKILLLAPAPHPDIAAIKAALEGVPQYKVTISVDGSMPASIQDYNLVIAHQPTGNPALQKALAQIPVWFILGSQTNLNAFNDMQTALKITGGGNPNVVLPELNTGFSYFTLPTGIREVMDKMPPLQAPYGNYVVSAGTQLLMRQKIGSVSTNYPLWLFQAGTLPRAVLCGEGIWRWRLYEYKNSGKHEIVDELIRQTVSLLSVKKDNRPFRLFMDKYIFSDNEPVHLYAELKNANGELVNNPDVTVIISDTAGHKFPYHFEKSDKRYYRNLGLLAPGSYRFNGSVNYNGSAYVSEGSFIVESVPLEDFRIFADYDLMYKLAHQSGGSLFTIQNMQSLTDSLAKNALIKPVIHTEKTYVSLIDKRWLFFFILLFAAGEWLLRKYWNL
jgi:hypothetical protein